MADENKFALLIDVDNISRKYLSIMLNEAKAYGSVTVRRAYGDWTDYTKKNWKDCLLEHSIIPMQQYSYTLGKNASDSTMIIDAMDILYTDNVDGFIIASSDSDFTRLAMRLREAGKMVVGMGEEKTPLPFVRSCEEFKYLDMLYQNTDDEEKSATVEDEEPASGSTVTKLSKIRKAIFSIISKNSDEGGRMLLSDLGLLLKRRYPEFDERNYGKYRKFSDFVRMIDGVEVEMVHFDDERRAPLAYVKRSETAAKKSYYRYNRHKKAKTTTETEE